MDDKKHARIARYKGLVKTLREMCHEVGKGSNLKEKEA